MRLSTRIKPISYVKANAAQVIEELHECREPLVITQNGEAAAVLVDVETYYEQQEALALLKLIALSKQQIDEGKGIPAKEAFAAVRRRRAAK
jgi:prevent-host-death family protein